MTRQAAALLLVALALAGCSGQGGTIFDVARNEQYFTSGTVPLRGAAPVVLSGDPPGISAEAFVGLLESPGYQGAIAFRLAPAREPAMGDDGFRFVFVFGARGGESLCSAPAPGGDAALIAGALCRGSDMVTRATLRRAPGDLAPQLSGLMQVLLPRPTRTNNDSPG